MELEQVTLLSAVILGLMGAGHCIGMCGGIISTLSMATDDKQHKWFKVISYQIGRISSYTTLGLIAGWLGNQSQRVTDFPVLQTISGVLLILMGLYISKAWNAITYLEKVGKLLWNKISPLSKHLLPVKSIKQALFLGALWGWLPCGLVYTSLGYALTLATPINSGLFMLFFGIGTLPATLAAGAASVTLKIWLNKKPVQWASALVLILFGFYILYGLFFADSTMAGHHHHH
ncbi:sulfite exporter TauE/SafE family protein [Aliikangiella maris]|uniref:Sulfite exporter TauE/SafE family protein n=2 Tax=Aliikangiella maris TaxID=3162458 RepID=A0ABV3MIS1_9GAMM